MHHAMSDRVMSACVVLGKNGKRSSLTSSHLLFMIYLFADDAPATSRYFLQRIKQGVVTSIVVIEGDTTNEVYENDERHD